MKKLTNILFVILIGFTISKPSTAQVEFIGFPTKYLPQSMQKLFGQRCMYQAIYKSDTLAYRIGDDSLFIFCPEGAVVGTVYLFVGSDEAAANVKSYCKAIYAESTVIPELYYTKIVEDGEDVWLYASKTQNSKYHSFRFYRGFPILEVEKRYKMDN